MRGYMVQVESTNWFNEMYERFSYKPLVKKRLAVIALRTQASPAVWLRGVDRLKNSAIPKIFADNAPRSQGAPRIILCYAPPVRLLDVGLHDDAEDRWTKSKPRDQIQRAESVARLPADLEMVLKVVLGHE